MKFCVLVVCAALAAASANSVAVISTITDFSNAFLGLIRTQSLIKEVESKNYKVLTPALSDITRELNQGINSDLFKFGTEIHNALVDVNIKVGQIAGNATSIVSQIESTAESVRSLKFQNKRIEYRVKKKIITKLCEETLATTDLVLGLIDDTKKILGKNVNTPLRMLQLSISATAQDRVQQEHDEIARQQNIIDHPPKWFFFFVNHRAVDAATALKQRGESTVNRIEQLVNTILDHAKWLTQQCQAIRNQLDDDRTVLSEIQGKIKNAKTNSIVVVSEFDALLNTGDENLEEGSQILVEVMDQLRNEVVSIAKSRRARDTGSNRPAWYRTLPSNNECFYIYNDRTTGCVSTSTFDFMKMQYDWLSDKHTAFEELFNNYDKGLKKLTDQVMKVTQNARNPSNTQQMIGLVAEIETSSMLWSDDVKKIRDLIATLNSYAESLFSNQNARKKWSNGIRRASEQQLNEDIKLFVEDIQKRGLDVINVNNNDVLGINNKMANILSQLSIPSCPSSVGTVPKRSSYYQPLSLY